jgi:quercetin dioxygenase-like cupin family protein
MKVTRIDPAHAEEQHAPQFVGRVLAQPLVADEAEILRLGAITFADGARTRLHRHDYDQVLLITGGAGILATPSEQHHVSPGDVVFVPAGEPHWHGAAPGASMTHVSINLVGTTVFDFDADAEPAP